MVAQETIARPNHEVRLGLMRAAIWRKETDNGIRCNVIFSRLDKDDQQWKASFGREDLPLLAKVADLAHTWIFESAQETWDSDDEGAR